MKKIESTMTLGEIVNSFPQLAREFERRGLDYCCGGRQTLDEACAGQGLDARSTTSELSAIINDGSQADWTTMSAVQLVDHLVETHHRYLWAELPRLSALVAKIVTAHGERHSELKAIAEVYEKVRTDLEPHLVKEEQVLFPMVRELANAESMPSLHCGTIRNPISVMLSEHEVVGELLAQMRKLTDNYRVPADGCPSYQACFAGLAELEADTHLHIHKENNLLFGMVLKMEDALARV